MSKYDHLTHDELVRLLEARDRRDATRFGLVWEANEIDRDNAVNADFVALDLQPDLCVGKAPYKNLIVEGDNFDALRHLRMTHAGRVLILSRDGGGRWMTVGYDEKTRKPRIVREFRISDAAGF